MNKNNIIFVLSIILCSGMVSSFSGNGDGSDGNPFQITNCNQLQEINDSCSSKYILMNDIDCNAINWIEICTNFNGTIDGQNFNVHNLFMNNTVSTGNVGLISSTIIPSIIRNIGFVDVYIETIGTTGVVAGDFAGTMENVYATGTIVTTNAPDGVGGLTGYFNDNSLMNNCWTNITIISYDATSVGGLVGWLSSVSTINNSYAVGNIVGDDGVGGLTGYFEGSVIDSYSAVTISGNTHIGGITGYNFGSIIRTFWNTDLYPTNTGGLGITDAEMRTINPFQEQLWDFTNIWQQCPNDYPSLQSSTICALSPLPQPPDITGQVTTDVVNGTVSVFIIVIIIGILLSLSFSFAGYIGIAESQFVTRAIMIILIGTVVLLLGIAFRMFVLV